MYLFVLGYIAKTNLLFLVETHFVMCGVRQPHDIMEKKNDFGKHVYRKQNLSISISIIYTNKQKKQKHTNMPAPTVEKEGFNEVMVEPLKQFAKDSMHLVKKCTKPDRKEFISIARATGIGFLIMGFIGFFVKLIHIPINNILVGN